ncbi:50S ribosomal protein L3 [Candidatus Cyanaurora vandensis]|uniref:50S ribosomal protein L3 n=1 Tax=Candidatus Cyanaurora vandensis TaxID=2714958 RepID=UPI00257E1A93|nr:50S ribosomal protein L3 [Candidatus Cyanaurora vandensis]
MALGLLGRKLGMTQIFSESGEAIPVTVVECGPCIVTQVKTQDKDGYNAIQVGFGNVSEKALTQPELGHLKKHEIVPLRHLQEFRLDAPPTMNVGEEVSPDLFMAGQKVDVRGLSIGKGFAGTVKRHHFGRGPKSHGSKNYRAPGSIGAGTTPGRVFPGVRMPGRMGNKQVTVRKLTVVRVDAERKFIIIKGALPGCEGNLLRITPTNLVGGK